MENRKDMNQSFLEQESKRANKKNMKLYLILLFVFIGLVAIIGYGVKDSFDLTLKGIIEYLGLKKPIFSKTTNYGHFGRDGFAWEEVKQI